MKSRQPVAMLAGFEDEIIFGLAVKHIEKSWQL